MTTPVNPITLRGSAIGQFEFLLDGDQPFYVKAVEGGFPKANAIEMAMGASSQPLKHLSTREIDPMTVEVGMQDGVALLRWIRQSWKNAYCRKDGHVKFGNFDMSDIYSIAFKRALIMESTFPTLDAAGKEAAMLKVKMQAEEVAFEPPSGSVKLAMQGPSYARQKMWTVNNFKLALGKMDTSRIAKIDGFTVKQGVKSYYTGRDRFPLWEPTKLTFPDLSIHVTYEYAKDLIKWYERTMMQNETDPALEVDGAITCMNPNMKTEMFEVKLTGVGVKGMSMDKSERADNPRRVKFDLYVRQMDI